MTSSSGLTVDINAKVMASEPPVVTSISVWSTWIPIP